MARDDGRNGGTMNRTSNCELAGTLNGFDHDPEEATYNVRYKGMVGGQPVFEGWRDPRQGPSLLGRFLARLKPNKRSLNIKMKRNKDMFVTVNAVGDLFWSTDWSAVMTVDDRTEYYGELEYLEGDVWIPRSSVKPGNPYSSIRFKAKSTHFFFQHSYAFSYNVRYGPSRASTEYEIDPDIKNPSM
jgi:hypothetical protein